ncbi:MAG TPA: TadE/TadG family type IV pilus assembly protein [Desulfobaccales bacterium]|jgi:Flp pilus assembly protein TadG
MSKEKLSKAARGRDASGNVIVELALVLPFLLLVIGGIVDLGLLYWEKHVITNASREGARAAARTGVGGAADQRISQVEQIVQSYLDRFHLKAPDGSPLVLAQDVTFFYTWDLSSSPGVLTVELKDIPVKLTLLPNIYGLAGGGWSSDPVLLKAGTTMAAEWSTAPLP